MGEALAIRLSTADLALVSVSCSLVGCLDDLTFPGLSEDSKAEPHLHATKCELAVQDVLCLELLNARAPSGWLLPGAAAAAGGFPDRLAELASDCLTCGEVLVAKADDRDLIFLPRRPVKPDACGSFMVVIGNLAAVQYHASLLRRRQVAVVLDLDHTILHTSQLASMEEFGALDWEYHAVEAMGKMISAGHAKLPALSPKGAGGGCGRYLLSFGEQGRFLLQLRPGWEQLRSFLVQDHRFKVTVCTHGRSFYMETVWRLLDPCGALIPQQEWPSRLRCARPEDGNCDNIPLKTSLFGTGVVSLWDPSLALRFGPLVIVEDNKEAYEEYHSDNLLVVPVFLQNTNGAPPESGQVLQEVQEVLEAFYAHTYGPDGSGGGAADMLLSEAKALTAQLQAQLSDQEQIHSLRTAFKEAGRRCWEAISLEDFISREAALPSGLSPGLKFLPSPARGKEKTPAAKFPASGHKRPAVELSAENSRQPLTKAAPTAAAVPAAVPASTAAGAAAAAAAAAATAAATRG